MEDDAVVELEGLDSGKSVGTALAAFLFSEAGGGEGIGRVEAVIAGMPACGVAQVAGMTEDGDAVGFVVDEGGIVGPIGGLAPDLFGAFLAVGVE